MRAVLLTGLLALAVAAVSIQPTLHTPVAPAARAALFQAARDAYRAAEPATTPKQPRHSHTEVDECLKYLTDWMPLMDVGVVDPAFLANTTRLALDVRHDTATHPWSAQVPWPVFLNDVLPYSVLSEPRDKWRGFFMEYFRNKTLFHGPARPTTLADAAVWVNSFSWNITSPAIHYVASPPNAISAYSVFEVIGNKSASCTGLSVFLVSALRSVGIPARLTGTPHWDLGPTVCPNGDSDPDCGNHDWVEAFTGGGWSFLDEAAGPPNARHANLSWFCAPANDTAMPARNHAKHQKIGTLNHTIFAASWGPAELQPLYPLLDPLSAPAEYFPMVWAWSDRVAGAFDVTARYLHMYRQWGE